MIGDPLDAASISLPPTVPIHIPTELIQVSDQASSQA